MDTLMVALVAALLVQATDRSAWAAAMLGTRFANTGSLVAGGLIALAITNAIAAAGAVLVIRFLTPEARSLLLALAFLSAGCSALFPVKPPKPGSGRGGAFVAALFGVLALALGDRMQFVTFALAARTPIPALPAIGATLGGTVVLAASALGGERGRRKLPQTAIRLIVAGVLLLTGAVLALGALRLL